ncbi:hypothetical protein CUT44_27760 [Streptomyces carminius]|uniref:Uncharacterized protein n=1 Tax=Streptomyces carminius TaxID=2665496 RepID=A0A2M8LQ64_9ACTN|nr:hypothetical protein [Streptomyces carminius]PJE94103.1 hypothetical protein CUT44_27760 [Streptomyces carminius]
MSLLATLARVEAAATGRARPLTTVCHRRLTERPMVLVPLTTAGEAGAPLGALVGTDRDAPRLLVVPQPRDRTLRFAFLTELADAVLPHLESAQDEVELTERTETDPETGKRVKVEAELCADAPQLIVPNTAGVAYVRLLGRSMRFRRTAEEDPRAAHPAPARLPLLGRWLTHYGERARVPGSALLLAMTELLGRHWATGQSRLEDQHLGALLAWITAGDGESGAEAALRAELARDGDGLLLTPPAGPATDPAFDNRRLAPAIARHDAGLDGAEEEIRELVAAQLRPTWDAVWRGLDLLRALPPGARVADRWKRDRWSYTAHRDRLRAGEPPQPRRDDAVTAARKLAARETALAELAAQEALDDPLVMAERRLAGEAFTGEVTGVETAYSEGRRPMPRPLVTVRTGDLPQLEEGGRVYRALPSGKSQSGEYVASPAPGLLTVRLTGGMGRGKVPEAGSVPGEGETVCWTLFEHAPRGGPELPDPEETPWTHGGPPDPDALDAPDPVTAEDLL